MAGITLNKRITNREDDSINAYFKDINKYKVLSAKEELDLTKQIKSTREALDKATDLQDRRSLTKQLEILTNKLVTANLRFVITVAKQYQGKGIPLVDLINEGNLGLIESVKHFDPDKGFRFMSYSIWWVRQAIIQALSNDSRMIRVPYTKATNLYKILVKKGHFEQEYGREPTDEELSKLVNLSVDQIKAILDAPKPCVSLETPFSSDDDAGCLLDITPNKGEGASNNLEKEDLNHLIHLMIDKLDNRVYDILIMYFGLDGVDAMPLKDIGLRFNFTEERARQLKNKALATLKERFENYVKENNFL